MDCKEIWQVQDFETRSEHESVKSQELTSNLRR